MLNLRVSKVFAFGPSGQGAISTGGRRPQTGPFGAGSGSNSVTNGPPLQLGRVAFDSQHSEPQQSGTDHWEHRFSSVWLGQSTLRYGKFGRNRVFGIGEQQKIGVADEIYVLKPT
jgi:hypothetical protein